MITLEDCRAFCDVDQAAVARLAQKEHLAEIVALACAQSRTMNTRQLQVAPLFTRLPDARMSQRLAA